MKQSITFVCASLGMIDVVVSPNPNYRNTFEIGDKRVCFDNVVPDDIDLRKTNFSLCIYDGVNVNCVLHYGRKQTKVEFNLLNVYAKTEEVYPR